MSLLNNTLDMGNEELDVIEKNSEVVVNDSNCQDDENDDEKTLHLHFSGLNGGDFHLSVPDHLVGEELLHALRLRVPPKPGANVFVYFGDTKLSMTKTLKEQGLQQFSSLCYVYLRRNALKAWTKLRRPVGTVGTEAGETDVFDGMTELVLEETQPWAAFSWELPSSLKTLTIGENVHENMRMEGVNLPKNLESLTFQGFFNRNLEQVNLPSGLKSLTFGWLFNQSLEGSTLPSSLLSLTFGGFFNQSLDRVKLPSSLQTLTFGEAFNQSLEHAEIPSGLESLILGRSFNQSIENVDLPSGLEHLVFGFDFDQSMENVKMPTNLKSLTFGSRFNQPLDSVTLPSTLQSLTFGWQFNQSLENVELPVGLQNLCFGFDFDQSLENVTLPPTLQRLSFGSRFNQNLELLETAYLPELLYIDCGGIVVSFL
mmetsp:Transcript_9873/g.22001  ORF Transcript_9873/g.22001 Transcript_9873/m.22001 type:complete len:427 (-) Transcript_9873:150-1430(-)